MKMVNFKLLGLVCGLVLSASAVMAQDRSVPLPYQAATSVTPKVAVCPGDALLKSDSSGKIVCSDDLSKVIACQKKGKFYAPANSGADSDGCVAMKAHQVSYARQLDPGFYSVVGSASYAVETRTFNLGSMLPSKTAPFMVTGTSSPGGGSRWTGTCTMFPATFQFGVPADSVQPNCYYSNSNSKKKMTYEYHWDGKGTLTFSFSNRVDVNVSAINVTQSYTEIVQQ